MAEQNIVKTLAIGNVQFRAPYCWEELGVTEDYLKVLLSRDEFAPILSAKPTSTTISYTDPATGVATAFHEGQCAIYPDSNLPDGYGLCIAKKITYNASNVPTGVIWLDTSISKANVEGLLTGTISTHTHTFASLASKPTTLQGYGITDAVTINTAQTISGAKTFSATLTAASFKKTGGTSAQFLKADGSIDSNTYLTTHQSLAAYLKIDGSNATTAGQSKMLSILDIAEWDCRDNTEFVTSHADGYSSTNPKFSRRKASLVWNYIKSKADSIYQPKGSYLTAITKAQVEAVLTGNITSHTHSQYLTAHQSLANYYTKTEADNRYVNTSGDTMTGSLEILKTSANPYAYVKLGMAGETNVILHNAAIQNSRTAALSIYQGQTRKGDIGVNGAEPFYNDANNLYHKILHDGNYASILDERYYTESEINTKLGSYLTSASALSTYVSTLGVSGNYLTWTKNGTSNNITIPYATEASRFASTSLNNGDDLNNHITSGLFHTTMTNVCTSLLNGPSGRTNGELWLDVRNVGTSGYGSQTLFTRGTTNFEYWLRTFNISKQFSAWQQVLTDANYASVLDTRYYTETEINTKLNSYLTTASASSTYVKKAGDTMTGCLTLTSGLAAAYNKSALSFIKTGTTTEQARIGTDANAGLGMYATGSIFIRPNVALGSGSQNGLVLTSSTITYNNNTLWHSGNDGSGSGLDADLLDGKHNGEITAKDLICKAVESVGITVADAKVNMLNSLKGNVFGNVTKVGADLIGNWGNETYTTKSNSIWSVINVTPQYDGDKYGQFLLFHYASYSPKLIGRDNNKWTSLRTFAFTDDTVAAANKLATARSIWGQSFNGTANISGNMSGVGDIDFQGNITLHAYNSLYARGYGVTGTNGQVLTNICGVLGKDNAYNYIYFGGTDYDNPHMVIINGGNVGIGTTTPACKLDVNGLIKATTGIQVGSLDDIGWYINTSRLSAGSTQARGVNVGSLLVSSAWADYTKVPTNGIYSKGNIITDGTLSIAQGVLNTDDNGDLTWNNNKVLHAGNTYIGGGSGEVGTITINGVYIPLITRSEAYGALVSKSEFLSYLRNVDGINSGIDAALVGGRPNGALSAHVLFSNSTPQKSNMTPGASSSIGTLTYYTGQDSVATSVSNSGFILGTSNSYDKWCFPEDGGCTSSNGSTASITDLRLCWRGSSAYFVDILASPLQGTLWYRAVVNSVSTPWKKFAFISDNVASATRLETTKTIWGRPFNGTQSIIGDLNQVGEISGYKNSDGTCDGISIKNGPAPKEIADLEYATEFTESSNNWKGLFVWADSTGDGFMQAGEKYTSGIYNLILQKFGGNVGIGNPSPAHKLDVTGVIHATTGIFSDNYVSAKGQNTSSDARLKDVTSGFTLDLNQIANAPSVNFSWKDSHKADVGSIAQYWRGISPYLTPDMPDGSMGLQYGKTALLSVITVAKKTINLQEEVKNLRKEVIILKSRIKELETK